MNALWLMQTPERVDNLPSPPYVINKEEIKDNEKSKQINTLQPPHATMKALNPVYEIMRCSINLKLDNECNQDVINQHINKRAHIQEISFQRMAEYQEEAKRINNAFLVNRIANDVQSPYLEGWEGTYHVA